MYIRNKDAVINAIMETDDGRLVAKQDLIITFPSNFVEHKLALIADDVTVVAMIGIIVGNQYGIVRSTARMIFTPSSRDTEMVNGEEYYMLKFNKGDTIVKNTRLLSEEQLPYWVYRKFIALGHVPWYFDYDDLLQYQDLVKKYCGVSLGATQTIRELIPSFVAKNPNNLRENYIAAINSEADKSSIKPVFVGLNKIQLSADTTITKVIGPYFEDGVGAAVTSPIADDTEVDIIERTLRE